MRKQIYSNGQPSGPSGPTPQSDTPPPAHGSSSCGNGKLCFLLNSASGLASTVVSFASVAVGYPVFLGHLGAEGYGVWVLLTATTQFLQLTNMGMGPATMRLVGDAYAKRDLERAASYVYSAIAFIGLVGLLILGTTMALRGPIVRLLGIPPHAVTEATTLLPLICLGIVHLFIVQVVTSVLSAAGKMSLANLSISIGRVVQLVASVVLVQRGLGLVALAIGLILNQLTTQLVAHLLIRQHTSLRLRLWVHPNRKHAGELLRFGGLVAGGNAFALLGPPISKILLSHAGGAAATTLYDMAFRLAIQLRAFVEAALRALMPEATRISADSGDHAERINRFRTRATWVTIAIGGLTMGSGIALTPIALPLWLRDAYTPEMCPVVRTGLAAILVNLIGLPSFYILLGTGHGRRVFAFRATTWAINVSILAVLYLSEHLTPLTAMAAMIPSWLCSTAILLAPIGNGPATYPPRRPSRGIAATGDQAKR